MWSLQTFILLFGLLTCYINTLTAAQGLTCFICDGVETPDQCTQLENCGQDAVCYMERYVRKLDAKKLYRGGCRSKTVCDIQTCLSANLIVGKRDESAGVACSECCTKQLCNLKLCHFDVVSEDDPNKALRCYRCDDMIHPEACGVSDICSRNEQCRVEVYFSNIYQDVRYQSDCYRTAECNATQAFKSSVTEVGRRKRAQSTTNLQLRSECCNHSLCNNFDPFNNTGHDNVGKIDSSKVNCPTTPATATTTTPTPTTTPTTTTTTTTPSTTTIPTTTTTTPTTTTTQTITVITTPKPTTPTTCYVCNGPPFLCESHVREQRCNTVDQQFCLNRFVNNDDGTRSVFRSCGTESECKVQWLAGTSDRHECTDYDTTQLHLYPFECTYCCTSALCNRNLVPPKSDLYVGHNHG
ncbi:integumentary mucin C.1-like isoform X4 [Pecten maximus]|uniref:integumentary mucin C.1-like isoform X4 n=1 Tax=Pecten maximus TaxID=6579 RepID=UPI001458FDE8|nr:integumentary mucin C.1-like isoform X4 [Pecten maximus]